MHSCQADACVNMDAYAYGTVDVVACLRLVLSRFWVMRASDDRADVLPPIFTSQARPAPAGRSLPAMCDPFMSRRLSRSSAISIIWLLRPTLQSQNYFDTGQRACICFCARLEKIVIRLVFSSIMEDDVKPSPFLDPLLLVPIVLPGHGSWSR